MALREGVSGQEISSFLRGGNPFIKPEDAQVILFAQHVVNTQGSLKKLPVTPSSSCALQSRRLKSFFKGIARFYEVDVLVMGGVA